MSSLWWFVKPICSIVGKFTKLIMISKHEHFLPIQKAFSCSDSKGGHPGIWEAQSPIICIFKFGEYPFPCRFIWGFWEFVFFVVFIVPVTWFDLFLKFNFSVKQGRRHSGNFVFWMPMWWEAYYVVGQVLIMKNVTLLMVLLLITLCQHANGFVSSGNCPTYSVREDNWIEQNIFSR